MLMKKQFLLTALLLFVQTMLFAEKEHLVTVVIQDDGSARVTHQFVKDLSSSDAEMSLGIDYPDGVEVSEISVSDSWQQYEVLDSWGGFWGGSARCCALEDTKIGYRIVWGTEAYDMTEQEFEDFERHDEPFQVAYTLKGLVRHYDDFDGLSFMFVNKEMASFKKTKLTISLANGKQLNEDNSSLAIAGFEGEWGWEGTKNLVAYTTEENQKGMKMIVSAMFSHGLIQPLQTAEGTFLESVDTRYTEDFLEDKQPTSFGDYIIYGFFILLAIVIVIGVLALLPHLLRLLFDRITFGSKRRLNQQKRFVEEEADYWRDLPFKGSIYVANYELNSTKAIRPVPSAAEAINAYILRLIYRGTLGINAQGQLTVGEWIKDKNSTPNDAKHEQALYELLLNASGRDRIVQEGEVAAYLKDFSLVGERHAVEVTLWREYMVFATLFGIADQVKKDMQTVCPEYLKMDELTNAMLSTHFDATPYASLISERAAVAEQFAPGKGSLASAAQQDYEQERE